VPGCYKQGTTSIVTHFCTGGCEDRTLARETEEWPLLEAVSKERLVKAQQTGKGLAGGAVICEMCLSMAL
jgi:hypothetical protein